MSPRHEFTIAEHQRGISLAHEALRHAVAGRDRDALIAVRELHRLGGIAFLWTTCGLWARMLNRAQGIPDRLPDGAGVGFLIEDEDGTTVDPDGLGDEYAPSVWAARFAAAHANRDLDTAHALFRAALPDDPDGDVIPLVDRVLTLLDLTAKTLLAVAEETR